MTVTLGTKNRVAGAYNQHRSGIDACRDSFEHGTIEGWRFRALQRDSQKEQGAHENEQYRVHRRLGELGRSGR